MLLRICVEIRDASHFRFSHLRLKVKRFRLDTLVSKSLALPAVLLLSEMQKGLDDCTFSLGSRLMVLRGRRTRRTLRDLIVLMSLPFVPLCTLKTTVSQTNIVEKTFRFSQYSHSSNTEAGCTIVDILVEMSNLPC